MSAPNPPGAPAPADGSLPQAALETLATTPFGVYVHVPFCAARCGYCDFNTYVPDSLRQEALAPTWTGKPRPAADMSDAGLFAAYVQAVNHELDLAQKVLGDVEVRTVYFGGGTPTLLPTSVQASILDAVKRRFRLAWDAEVSTEANPESVSGFGLDALAIAGFNRISLGMQSAVPRVLQLLDRRHTPGRVAQAVEWARQAGFSSVGVDLIYGSPTETAEEWRQSLRAAIDMGPDHVSAYSLTLEPGTRLERRVRSGEFEAADPDTQADYYQLAEDELGRVGLRSYEISNWAKAGHECRHNLAYWHSDNWWGLGPGAHSHIGGVRWWNVRHPRDYIARLGQGVSPAQGREELTAEQRRIEAVMLSLRLDEGLDTSLISGIARDRIPWLVENGLAVWRLGRLALTVRGRLMADAVTRELLD